MLWSVHVCEYKKVGAASKVLQLQHFSMAFVVPCASYYGHGNVMPYGRGSRGDYLSMFMYRGPRFTPQPRLSYHDPNMTLRQICCMLKVMKQMKKRERAAATAAAAAARKQASVVQAPASPGSKSDKKCVLSCVRYKRSIKRVG